MNWRAFLILAVSLTLWAAQQPAPAGAQTPFAQKAQELTTGCGSRAEKIIALHAFVRDKIRESPATYG